MAVPDNLMSCIQFEVADNGTDLIAHYTPMGHAAAVNPEDLRDLIIDAGYGQWRITDPDLKELAQLCRLSNRPGKMTVARKLDGEFRLNISDDRMRVMLAVYPPFGGNAITFEQVMAAIESKGICYGLKTDVIRQAVEDIGAEPVEIATGDPVRHGEDTHFIPLYENLFDIADTQASDFSATDLEMEDFIIVRPGQALMRRTPASTGKNGRTVFNKIVEAISGTNFSYAPQLQGVTFDEKDPDLICAAITGQPVLVERGVKVDPVLSLPAVNTASGDVEFEGTVRVINDISSGMKVTAGGDIYVFGAVERAQLYAGGNIIIANGIIGRGDIRRDRSDMEKHMALLHAGGNVHAKFIENATVKAGHDVVVDNLIAHSTVDAMNRVVVGAARGSKGHIIGGTITAAIEIQASVSGSRACPPTKLQVGAESDLLERSAQIRTRILAREKEKAKLYQLRDQLQKTDTAAQAETLARVNNTLMQLQADLVKLLTEQEQLKEKARNIIKSKVVLRQQIFDGTEVCIGGVCSKVYEKDMGGVFTLVGSRLRFKSSI